MSHSSSLRRCITYGGYATGAVFVASISSAWYHRPIVGDASSGNPDGNSDSGGGGGGAKRRKELYSPPWNRDDVPILLELARRISIGATTLAIRAMMNTYGRYDIRDDEHYRKFLQIALDVDCDGGHRSRNQGLITVSNHRSVFDDPGIVSCLLPLPIAMRPKYNRWAICSQEYCYNDALSGLIHGYIGAGQVLPICRGAGINQRLLRDFGRHLACGQWCHIFPEGGVWQWDELGGRRELPPNASMGRTSDFDDASKMSGDENGAIHIIPATRQQRSLPPSSKGKLKWGVGKLIAHAPVTPKVIPFAHAGMETLFPQHETTGKTRLRDGFLRSLLPGVPLGEGRGDDDTLRVRIRFGEEIAFDDLIRDHERKHGKVWKYHGREGEGQKNKDAWNSIDAAERALYSKIAQRIESRLDVITKEVCREE